MAKTIPTNAATELAKQYGSEPQIIVKAEWNDGANPKYYSDLNHTNSPLPLILDISGFDESFNTTNTTNVGVVTISLSDVGDAVSDDVNTYNLYATQFIVYLVYPTLTNMADWVVLMKGKGSGPLTWDEHNRSVSFSITPNQHFDTVGFSLRDDDEVAASAINPMDDAVGQPYPICWGNPLRVPALKIQEPFHATVEEDLIIDDTIGQTIKLNYETGSAPAGPQTFVIANSKCTGTISDDILSVPVGNMNQTWYTNIAFATRPLVGVDPDTNSRNIMWVSSAATELAGKYCYTGTNYQRCVHQEGTKCWFLNDWYDSAGSQPAMFTEVKGLPDESWATYESVFRAVSWFTAGAEVYWFDDVVTTSVYVFNLFPSSSQVVSPNNDVAEVMAYRTFGVKDEKKLAAVPSDRLDIEHDYPLPDRFKTDHPDAPTVCSVVKINKPLFQYEEEKWDDSVIYVSHWCHSDNLRRNPAQIIEDLIDYYAPDLSVDSTSFTAVKTKLAKFLMSGWIADEMNLWDLITQIALQARCAVYLRNDTVYIQYLSEKPTAYVGSFDATSTLEASMSMELSPDTDIVTSIKGSWVLEGSQDKPFEIIKTARVGLYGSRESNINFFMYSSAELVEKTMEFWLNRSSHIWRNLKVESTIHDNISVDAGDYCDVYYPNIQPLGEGTHLFGQATGLSYDTLTHKINYTLWTPVAYGFGDLTDTDAWLSDVGAVLPSDPIAGRALVDYIPLVYRVVDPAEFSTNVDTTPEPGFSYVYFGYVSSYSGTTLVVDLYDKDGNKYTSGEYYHVNVTVLSTGGTNVDYNVPWIKAGMYIQLVQINGVYYYTGGLATSVYRG